MSLPNNLLVIIPSLRTFELVCERGIGEGTTYNPTNFVTPLHHQLQLTL